MAHKLVKFTHLLKPDFVNANGNSSAQAGEIIWNTFKKHILGILGIYECPSLTFIQVRKLGPGVFLVYLPPISGIVEPFHSNGDVID